MDLANPPSPAGSALSALWATEDEIKKVALGLPSLADQLLSDSCAFLKRHRTKFDTGRAAGTADRWRRNKALCELAVFASTVLRSSCAMHVEERHLMEVVAKAWCDRNLAEVMAVRQNQFRLYGTIYACMSAAGLGDPLSDEIFSRIVDDGYIF